MGIKFYCPQGHKLHVKSFLAGKKGVCPHCGAKVRIPHESQRGHKEDDGSPEPEESDISSEHGENRALVAGAREVAQVGAVATPVATPVANQPQPLPSAAPGLAEPLRRPAAPVQPALAAASPAPVVGGASLPMGTPAAVSAAVPVGSPRVAAPADPVFAVAPATPVAIASPTSVPAPLPAGPTVAVPDPFADALNAEWYICPPSGGRYGPATSEILKRWIAEGRVTPDSLVWRSGWSDWRAASAVLPAMAALASAGRPGSGGPPPAPISPAVPVSPASGGVIRDASKSAATAATSNYVAHKRSNSSLGVIIVVLLGVISVALLGALVWVLRTKS